MWISFLEPTYLVALGKTSVVLPTDNYLQNPHQTFVAELENGVVPNVRGDGMTWNILSCNFYFDLLDNKLLQPKKSIKNTYLYGLNYFIIQEFNPNKKYFLYMSWVFFDMHFFEFNHYQFFFQHLLFDMNFFEFNHYQIYFYQPRLFAMNFFALQTRGEGGLGNINWFHPC